MLEEGMGRRGGNAIVIYYSIEAINLEIYIVNNNEIRDKKLDSTVINLNNRMPDWRVTGWLRCIIVVHGR